MTAAASLAAPTAIPFDVDTIPGDLAERPQWVSWGFERREDKWTKPPISPITGRYASATDAATWGTLEQATRFAAEQHQAGVGFVVTPDDPYVGLDIDGCRNAESEAVEPWATDIIDRFNSYTEISPSGTGIRIWIRTHSGLLPGGSHGRRKGPIEVYAAGRYFTCTGARIGPNRAIGARTAELAAFCQEHFGPPAANGSRPPRAGSAMFSDEDVLTRAREAANGAKFVRLWAGDTSEYGGDDSAADLALVSTLRFWAPDPAQLDRLFRRSGLYREKWDRADYRERTIEKALAGGETYDPTHRAGVNANGANPHSDGADGTEGSASSEESVSGVSAWPARKPLPPRTPPAPTLPEALVPEPLRRWLVDAADRSRVPLEMLAGPAVVAAGGLNGRKVGIRPGRFDEFTAVTNLWGALVAPPGWMKTQSYKEPYRPIGRLIARARAEHQSARRQMDGKAARLKAELKAIERRMDRAARGEPPKEGQAVEDLATLEAEYAAKSAEAAAAVATERRYLTQDPTVEKFGELLRENPRGMTLLRDELSGWLLALDKPGREGDREFYLEAWNGTGSFTVDRIARGTLHIPALTISVFGGIQPGKLRRLSDEAIDGGAGDDGMMQRFQVLIAPDALPAWSQPTGWGDVAAKERADATYAALDAMTPDDAEASPADIPFLRYSEAAQTVADLWRDALEARLRSGELDDTPAFASHLSKYRSLMPALALTFYLIDLAAKSPGVAAGAVGESHARLAADWCGFLEEHARKVYAAETQRGAAAAHALADKIEAGAIFDGQPVRDLYRAQWAGLRSSERVLLGLSELTDLGWVRVESRATGANPSQVVRLHPDLLTQPGATEQRGEGDA